MTQGSKERLNMKRVIVPLAEGAEEMEATIIIDILRRARWEVVVAGLDGNGMVTCSRNVRIVPDTSLASLKSDDFDVLALPGGKNGTDRLMRDSRILDLVREFVSSGRIVAAVCAAPLVLQAAGILNGKKFTCHPAVRRDIVNGEYINKPVVVDGRIVTSQGAGTCIAFALAIISMIESEKTASTIADEIIKT
jgi:protein DJ-1